MKKSRFFSVILASIISLSATGCYFLPEEEKIIDPPTVKVSETGYTTITAKKKDIETKLSYSGKIISEFQHDLTFATQGAIKELNVKAGDVVKKGDVLAKLDMDELEYKIKEKELYIKRAELNIKVMKEQGASQAEIDMQQVDKEILEHELVTLDEQRDSMVIVAPDDGVIMTSYKNEGDWVSEEDVVFVLIDPESVYIAIQPEDVKQFPIDTQVFIKIYAKLEEGIVFMNPDNIPEDDKDNPYDIDFDKQSVYVKFKGVPPEDCVNRIVDVNLILERHENVVVVANNVIKKVNGEDVVYLLKDGKKVASKVEIGIKSGSQSEIVSGVEEGDKIVIR